MFFRFLVAAIFTFTSNADAQTQRIDYTEVELIADSSQAQAGGKVRAGIRYKMDPEWHIYWKNPGDSGIPTSLNWLNAELAETKVNQPFPHKFIMEPMANYGWSGEVVLWSEIDVPENASELFLQAQTTFLMCRDICLPGDAVLNLAIPVGAEKRVSAHIEKFDNAQKNTTTQPLETTVSFDAQNKAFHINLPQGYGKDSIFIPKNEGTIEDYPDQKIQNGTLIVLQDRFDESTPEKLEGVLVNGNHKESSLVNSPLAAVKPIAQAETQTAQAEEIANMTLVTALILAFVGGMILNLMPCVLPVLSLKVMGLIHHAQSKWSWFYGLVYTAGVLFTFYLLALALVYLKSQGMELGWGFQLQEPMFVAVLTLILFLVALELFDVYEIGTTFGRLQNIIGNKNNVLTTFLSGMLITVVATPCTVPFMGGAVAFSLAQESNVMIQVFLMLGFGLAFPYLVLTFIPGLHKYLPKPGPWEERFQEFLGFPMMATALWLLWVYANQTSVDELFSLLAGLFVLALGAWVYGHMGSLNSTRGRKLAAVVIFYSSLVYTITSFGGHKVIAKDIFGIEYFEKADRYAELYETWSPQTVKEAKEQGRPIFINFTADWCITCKANEFGVLKTDEVMDFFENNGILVLKGDWTMKDETITQELAKYGRRGVPLYIAVDANGKEMVLPQILTPSAIEEGYP